jgi:hypothetical protein
LVDQQCAKRKSEMTDLTFLRTRPRPQVPNRHGQGLKCRCALSAEEMELFVLVRSPDFVPHGTSSLTVGNRGHLAASQRLAA